MPPLEPFTIEIPAPVLDDLRRRLHHTRWSRDGDGGDSDTWEDGANPSYMRALIDYWREVFDWRAQEVRLNRFAHFHATVDGTRIHLIHERGRGPAPLPLLLTHGYPDSFYRFYKLIPLLTDPAAHGGDAADAFDVVAPSPPTSIAGPKCLAAVTSRRSRNRSCWPRRSASSSVR
jgi:pimeloyl-ACP methyl ester carboxylesterase